MRTVADMAEPVRPRFASAALVTIDIQRDVLDSGPLGIPGTTAILPQVCRLAETFRRASRPAVHMVRLYQPGGANADPCRRILVGTATKPVLRPGTDGAELADGLLPPGAGRLDAALLLAGGIQDVGEHEAVIYKPRWGAFYDTPLEQHLHSLAVDTLVVSGCNFPNCTRTSVYEASERDYRLVLADDAVSGLYPRGISELEGIGVAVLPTDTIIGYLATAVGPRQAAPRADA